MTSRVDPSYLINLLPKTENIRNFCILAHVDHGKTTLSDSLVCSNGVISPKLAGKARYLDSTEEEQRRGITMHSSAISLLFKLEDKTNNTNEDYLINLVDSPGHIDFSSDVSTATRLCDGALIVVDVLEGLCTQTHAVLYKALKERMRPCLVLNKIDRLILELKLTTTEAFHHLRRIIENVNALAYTLLTSEIRLLNELNTSSISEFDETSPFAMEWNFSPEKGNVIFTSGLDSWGCSINKFANIWSKKLDINKNLLTKYLFDDYLYNQKLKKIVKIDYNQSPNSKPLFASLILDPIWQLYEAAIIEHDPEKAAKMAHRGLGVDLPQREINNRDPRLTIQAIFRKWLPLSDALLRMIVRNMSNPILAQTIRIHNLITNPTNRITDKVNDVILNKMKNVYSDILTCNANTSANQIIFISKMTPIRVGDLSAADLTMISNKNPNEKYDNTKEIFMALGRVFSGVIDKNSCLYVLGNRHDPLVDTLDITSDESSIPESLQSTVKILPPGSFGLYICLGPSVYPIDKAYAGNIIGIIGLDDFVFKTGTVSSTWMTEPMKSITFQAKPMVRVAVEPLSHNDLNKLEIGMHELYQYDPVVEIGVDDSGQHIMTCLGELHLELCVKTLQEKFAKCELKVSEPLVSFREAVLECVNNQPVNPQLILPTPWKEITNLQYASNGRYKFNCNNNNISFTIRCFPLPSQLVDLLDKSSSELSSYDKEDNSETDSMTNSNSVIYNKIIECISLIPSDESTDISLRSLSIHNIISFGPRNIYNNMIIFDDRIHIIIQPNGTTLTNKSTIFNKVWSRIRSSVIAGFQVVSNTGPIIHEPLHGVCYVIECVEINVNVLPSILSNEDLKSIDLENIDSDGSTIMSGHLISEIKDGLYISMLSCPLRIVEPIYICELQCDTSFIGSLYSVLTKRRGVVIKEDIIDGTNLLLLTAHLPVAESFGFAQELLKKTSGNGTAPQLAFSHWSNMKEDPFWKPKTEEELEEYGDANKFNELNKIRLLIDKIRKRKGLPIEEKLVVNAEKQRTLKK